MSNDEISKISHEIKSNSSLFLSPWERVTSNFVMSHGKGKRGKAESKKRKKNKRGK